MKIIKRRSEQSKTRELCNELMAMIEKESSKAAAAAEEEEEEKERKEETMNDHNLVETIRAAIEQHQHDMLQDVVLMRGRYKGGYLHDQYGLLLHCALSQRRPNVEVVRLLLELDRNKETVSIHDSDGWLPLHCACAGKASLEILRLLHDHDEGKQTVFGKIVGGRLPIDIALSNQRPTEIIQFLVRWSLAPRIQQLGLNKWRTDMEKFMERVFLSPTGRSEDDEEEDDDDEISSFGESSLSSETLLESYNNTRGEARKHRIQIHHIHSALATYERMEVASLLELAIWKENCRVNGREHNKQACFVMSGSGTIVPRVLSFL